VNSLKKIKSALLSRELKNPYLNLIKPALSSSSSLHVLSHGIVARWQTRARVLRGKAYCFFKKCFPDDNLEWSWGWNELLGIDFQKSEKSPLTKPHQPPPSKPSYYWLNTWVNPPLPDSFTLQIWKLHLRLLNTWFGTPTLLYLVDWNKDHEGCFFLVFFFQNSLEVVFNGNGTGL